MTTETLVTLTEQEWRQIEAVLYRLQRDAEDLATAYAHGDGNAHGVPDDEKREAGIRSDIFRQCYLTVSAAGRRAGLY